MTYESDCSFLDWQLKMLQQNDASFQSLSLNLNRMEKSFSQQLAHWRESLFSYQVTQWLQVIRQNTTVETVTLDMSVPDNTIWKRDQLRALLYAIVSLPKLRRLVLRQDNLGAPRRLSSLPSIIAAIKQHHSIECLELWGNEIVPGIEELLLDFATVVEEMETLQCFKLLGFRLQRVHIRMFIPLMSKPSLKEFCLGNTSEGFVPVAANLKTNTNLEKLTLCFMSRVEDKHFLHLVNALQENKTLQILSLLNASPTENRSGISIRCKAALVQAMRQNMTLQDFKAKGQLSEELHLYLKLNRIGRRELFHNSGVTRELWVDTLISSSEDPDCSFYFLTMNPSICVS